MLTPVCRLLSERGFVLGVERGAGRKCGGTLRRTEAVHQTCTGTPFSAGFLCPLEPQGFPDELGAAFQGATKAGFWEECVTERSEMELRCDSGAQSEGKGAFAPRGDGHPEGWALCGDLAERFLGPTAGPGAWRDRGHSSTAGDGEPWYGQGRKTEGGRHGQTCLINFRPLPSRTICAFNLF